MRFKNYLFLAISACCLIRAKAYCQDIPKELYVASGIPDSLKVDANSVIRYNMETYDVAGPGKFVYKSHAIVTVLNEKGNHEAEVSLQYNKKYSTVGAFEMKIYDADGKLIKKYHKSDMYDHAAEDYESLVTDDRVLEIEHTIANYPTTVEITYEKDNSSLINLDGWAIQEFEQSVQNTSCKISIKSDAWVSLL